MEWNTPRIGARSSFLPDLHKRLAFRNSQLDLKVSFGTVAALERKEENWFRKVEKGLE